MVDNPSVRWGPNGPEFDEARLKEISKQYRKDSTFLEAHLEEWSEKYPDMYVAVYGEALVGVAATPEELVKQLKAKGVPSNHSCWEFLDTDPTPLILYG